MSMSDIIRVSSGCINTVNDTVAGGVPVGTSNAQSMEPGILGKYVNLDDDQIICDTAMGTVFGGVFQYVQLAESADQPVVGQIVFWAVDVNDDDYIVTTSEAGSVPGAQFRAGIVLNADWEPGNYSFIQVLGRTFVQFRAVLSVAGQVGTAVYCAAAGAGVDNGFADCIDSGNPTLFSDVTLMQNRYIGAAIQAPTNAGLKLVNVNMLNPRG